MRRISLTICLALIWFAGQTGAADFDGDKTADLAVFRASTGLWAIRGVTRAYFGAAGDAPVPGDYRGEGRDRMAIFRSTTGLWAVRGVTKIYFGSSSDSAVPGDLDGDGTEEFAVFRKSSGLWASHGLTRFYFGGTSDRGLPPGRGAGPLRCRTIVTGQTASEHTGDDGDLQAGAPFDLDMFSLPGGAITVDNNTGLIWASDGSGKGCCWGQQTDWESAVNWCNNLNFAGCTDWRLPNIKELYTIVDASESYPCIDPAKFPNTKDDMYWTSTTFVPTSANAWLVKFNVGGLNNDYPKNSLYFLRAVTGPDL